MDLVLKRHSFTANGIFGELVGTGIVTLEHSYESDAPPSFNHYEPKLPPGRYACLRGQHVLHSGPIETFEVMNVPGHKGILFHCGNIQVDSEGCILLGLERMSDTIAYSRNAFTLFMELQKGVNEFTLLVN